MFDYVLAIISLPALLVSAEGRSGNDAPPSYDSLYGRIKQSRQEAKNPLHFLKMVFAIICGTGKACACPCGKMFVSVDPMATMTHTIFCLYLIVEYAASEFLPHANIFFLVQALRVAFSQGEKMRALLFVETNFPVSFFFILAGCEVLHMYKISVISGHLTWCEASRAISMQKRRW